VVLGALVVGFVCVVHTTSVAVLRAFRGWRPDFVRA
jgi:hypothetical protein